MMSPILLDLFGDAPVNKGFTLVESEVDFLKLATSEDPIHVRGERLCNWAEIFYRGREIAFEIWNSPIDLLRNSFPKLSIDHIEYLVECLGDKSESLRPPITAQSVLQILYPSSLWGEYPTILHGAEWLLWVYEQDPPPEIRALLADLCAQWLQYVDDTYQIVYEIRSRSEADLLLQRWLGILDRDEFPSTDNFPIEIPPDFFGKARVAWRKQMIESKGALFHNLNVVDIPFALKRVAAEEAFDYFIHNPDFLDPKTLSEIGIYLDARKQAELRKIIPPKAPVTIPDNPEGVLEWFKDSYFPYREWQYQASSPHGKQISVMAARRFVEWYLDYYFQAMVSSTLRKWINFHKMLELAKVDDMLVLVIILDGLHVGDARLLSQLIQSSIPRLNIAADELAFTSIPTITPYAKEAMLKGVPPDKILHVDDYIGIVLPESASPVLDLAKEKTGIFIWRIQEPDRTYHDPRKNKSSNLLHDIEGRLRAEVSKIKEIVEKVPSSTPLQIIITSDHGRMLGKSERILPIPDEMQSHGRVALGESEKDFPKSGYVIENDEIVFLCGEVFSIPEDAAITLNESAFLNNDGKRGSENFPHGGLFPEEVIVPWVVMIRDQVKPQVDISINGDGRAGMRGHIRGIVVNSSDVEITLERLVIIYKDKSQRVLDVDLSVRPRDDAQISETIDDWPDPSKAKDVTVMVALRHPNRLVFEYLVQTEFVSTDLYVEADNFLEDLDI